jgi:murein DD-endopeptidase MepM/ murein hydrolase activator NlpD
MRSARAVSVGLFVLAALVPALDAGAASKDDQFDALQEQIGEASAAEVDALADLGRVQQRRASLDARVAALDAEITTVQARIASQQREATILTAAALELDRRAELTARRLRRAERRFDESAAALYTGNTEPQAAYAGLVLDAHSLNELGSGRAYLENVSVMRQHAVEQLDGLRARNARLHNEAEQRRALVEVARQAAVVEQQTLGSLRAEQAVQRNAAANQETRERTVVARIRSRKAEYTAELAGLQATSTEIRALLYDLQVNQPRASNFHVERPVPGEITSGFGPRYHPVLGYGRMHTGIDFRAAYGSSIHAAAPGRVVWSGVRGGYGNAVVIDHGNQYATLYGHASQLLVEVGAQVDTGDPIAAAGATGLATGPHLHFEVRILGNPVDPAQYL